MKFKTVVSISPLRMALPLVGQRNAFDQFAQIAADLKR
jgi:hypothetical protein